MDITTTAVATGAIAIAGRFASQGKKEGRGSKATYINGTNKDHTEKGVFSVEFVLGIGFYAIFLSLLSSIDDQLARGIGILVLVGVLLRYGVAIFSKAGLA